MDNKYGKLALDAANQGNWDSAIKLLRYAPKGHNYDAQIAQMGIPKEHLPHFLNTISYYHKNDMSNTVFELANNIPDDYDMPELSKILEHSSGDNLVSHIVKTHKNYDLTKDPEALGAHKASEFWRSYETSVKPEHFGAINKLMTGSDENIATHRGISQLSTARIFDGKVHHEEPAIHKRERHKISFMMHEAIPHLKEHAKKVQDAIMADNEIQKRNFGGKTHIFLYRGIGGSYGQQIHEGLKFDGNEVDDKKVTLPVSSFSSFSTDKNMAQRFAAARGEHDGVSGKGAVFGAWVPLEHVLHSGFHTVHPGQEHAHDSEYEIVVGHPKNTIKVPSKNFEMQTGAPDQHTFTKPKVRQNPNKLGKSESEALQKAKINLQTGKLEPEHTDPEGMPHPDSPSYVKGRSVKTGKKPVWKYRSDIADGFDKDAADALPKFKQNMPEHANVIDKMYSSVAKDGDRHVVDSGVYEPEVRMRHLSWALQGKPGYSLNHTKNGFQLTAERHSKGKPTVLHTWNFDGNRFKFSHSSPISDSSGGGSNEKPKSSFVVKPYGKSENGSGSSNGQIPRREPRDGSGVYGTDSRKAGSLGKSAAGGTGKLSKGQAGDWKKEGYKVSIDHNETFTHHNGMDEYTVKAHSPSGEQVGMYTFWHKGPDLKVDISDTKPSHQRKGLASEAYRLIQNHLGVKLNPGSIQTHDAEKLWAQPNRPFGKADLIPGGLADNKTIKDFPAKKIKQGEKVEMEHTSSKKIAQEVAMDHLTEDKNYYTKLARMEKAKAPDEETSSINQNKKLLIAKKRHKFMPAKWTHPNGHPRCMICGDEERIGGICDGVKDSLQKGLKGDWKAEGYTFTHDQDGKGWHTISARTPKGEVAGIFNFTDNKKLGTLKPQWANVGEEHQRKGLASEAYRLVQKNTGLKLLPSDIQTEAGKQLWSKNHSLTKSKKEDIGQVASVAVMHGGKILMAKRNDNGKMTLPGGHMDKGETPEAGALRELFEEAGVKPDDIHYLGNETITTKKGEKKKIHAFICFGKHSTSTKNDPDKEVSKWEWVDCGSGKIPKAVKDNLHSPKNVVLKKLNLL